ncbi:MAG: hypothetical protein QME50_02965 [Candidatus Bathyarchaeota archaeon]|nr:hypothetical protein [Candidatus Bathyarchaeota archaeon]
MLAKCLQFLSQVREILRFTQPKRLKLVYNGVDAEKLMPSGAKEDLVITVGAISDSAIKKKGWMLLLKHLPTYPIFGLF